MCVKNPLDEDQPRKEIEQQRLVHRSYAVTQAFESRPLVAYKELALVKKEPEQYG